MKRILGLVMVLGLAGALLLMAQEGKLGSPVQKFQQLESLLPTPSSQRLAFYAYDPSFRGGKGGPVVAVWDPGAGAGLGGNPIGHVA